VRGLNALIGIVSTKTTAPIIVGSRLRKGAAGSPRGAGKFVGDVLATVRRLRSASAAGLVRFTATRSSQPPTGPARRYRSRPGWTRP